MIAFGSARFTFLTDRMLRLEWAGDGVFEDRPTLVARNRSGEAVAFERETEDNRLVLRTNALTVTFEDDGRPFHPENLAIQIKSGGATETWHPGSRAQGNLKGTVRTLDADEAGLCPVWKEGADGFWHATGEVRENSLSEGFLSRDGWTLVDDSRGIPLETEAKTGRPWVQRPRADALDWYFLGYGRDYKAALRGAALVFGHQPLPPRFTLGYWYSRYWAYTDEQFFDLVDEFDRRELPIDVMVVDMDWHKPGWTGYSWEPAYFPDPGTFLRELHERDLRITLNLHPADGVGPHEDAYPLICEAVGQDPAEGRPVKFDITDPVYMDAYFRFLHHPEEDRGVDFWWLDWQQEISTAIEGLDPLPWLNQLHWEDMERRDKNGCRRPLCFSRFGGPGAGRYPIGFSGDTKTSWKSLAYQPWFTATASNVLYGYWSHDIGGHAPGPVEAELYLRWIQFGVYSPILRTHTTKSPDAERRIWRFEDPYSTLMADQLRLRYELVPYIYTANRRACETGISLLRPMYYDWPETETAYEAKDQYFFGDDWIVSPVITPSEPSNGLAAKRTWLPEGDWWDLAWGRMVGGGRWIDGDYGIGETPVFARAGSIRPILEGVRRLVPGSYPTLCFECLPGGDGSYVLYEDDGVSQDYLAGKSVWLGIRQVVKGPHEREVTIGPAEGDFDDFASERRVRLRFPVSGPGCEATLDGVPLACDQVRHDPATMTLEIDLGTVQLRREHRIQVAFDPDPAALIPKAWTGLMNRLNFLRDTLIAISDAKVVHPEERLGTHIAQTPRRIQLHPEHFSEEMQRFQHDLGRLPFVLDEYLARIRKAPNHFGDRLIRFERAVAMWKAW